jgi:hypothetical protein
MKDVRLEIPDMPICRNVSGYNLARTVAIYRDGRWYNGSFILLPLSLYSFLASEAKRQGKEISAPVKVSSNEPAEPKAKEPKEKKSKGPKVVKKLQGFNPFLVGE